MRGISLRDFAVISATAVTAVGSVVGVTSANAAQNTGTEPRAAGATLLADILVGHQARAQAASLARQAEAQAAAADERARKGAEAAARKAAAEAAVAKKEAQVRQRTREKAEEQEATSGTASGATTFATQSCYDAGQIQAMARQMVPSGQWQCFSNIVEHESS